MPTRRVLLTLTLLISIAVPTDAIGGDEPGAAAEPAAPATAPKDDSLDHKYQIGFGARIGSGFRVIFPYNKEFCGDAGKTICTARYPTWLELSPSFGVTQSLELLVDVRLFLENPDFTAANGFAISPGVKYYTDPEDMFKFFITGQVYLESQDQRVDSDLNSFDLGLRSTFGLQVDLLRYVGLYAQAGIVLGFVRWFSFLADFSGGLQVRY